MGHGSIPWMKILRTEIHCSSNCRACVRGFGHQARRVQCQLSRMLLGSEARQNHMSSYACGGPTESLRTALERAMSCNVRALEAGSGRWRSTSLDRRDPCAASGK